MIKLHGYPLSNYYNMVKFALIEKNIDFEDVIAVPRQGEISRNKSPLGQVPFIETDQGSLSDTMVILGYLETIKAEPALLPKDTYEAAKVWQVCKVLELNIELQARRHFGELFWDGARNESAVTDARTLLEKGLYALSQLGSFDPYLCGAFSIADIYAAHTFIYAGPACQKVYGWDIVAEVKGLQHTIDKTNARKAGAMVAADQQAALKTYQ